MFLRSLAPSTYLDNITISFFSNWLNISGNLSAKDPILESNHPITSDDELIKPNKKAEAKPLDFLLNETGLDAPTAFKNVPVKSISCDSRSVHKGGLFFGLPGEQVDGGCFWRQAISRGAVAAIISKAAATLDPPNSEDMVFVVPDQVSYWMGEMASAFWDKPSLKMDLIGVTGTNGKTTITY